MKPRIDIQEYIDLTEQHFHEMKLPMYFKIGTRLFKKTKKETWININFRRRKQDDKRSWYYKFESIRAIWAKRMHQELQMKESGKIPATY